MIWILICIHFNAWNGLIDAKDSIGKFDQKEICEQKAAYLQNHTGWERQYVCTQEIK